MKRDGTGQNTPRAPQGLDEVLNIFALANSIELVRGAERDRVLEWYRDRGTRRIHLLPGDPSSFDVDVTAEFTVKGVRREVRHRFRSGVTTGEIRALLAEAVAAANALLGGGDGAE
jgi:hypothetical protein